MHYRLRGDMRGYIEVGREWPVGSGFQNQAA
jgi:hypothetical protein